MHPIRKFLKKNNLKLNDFAVEIGTSPAYLCHLMAGIKKPSPDFAKKIINATDGEVRAEDLRPDLVSFFSLP